MAFRHNDLLGVDLRNLLSRINQSTLIDIDRDFNDLWNAISFEYQVIVAIYW